MEYLACPKCGCTEFTEYAKQFTSQAHVKIDKKTRKPDYDGADMWEASDDFEVINYECEQCEANFTLILGKLVEEV